MRLWLLKRIAKWLGLECVITTWACADNHLAGIAFAESEEAQTAMTYELLNRFVSTLAGESVEHVMATKPAPVERVH